MSNSAILVTGSPIISGGTGTTTTPLVYLDPGSTSSSIWSTSGTVLGINAPTGFSGNLVDFQQNGASKFSVTAGGTLLLAGTQLEFGNSPNRAIMAPANNALQLGPLDGATASAQVLSAQGVTTVATNGAGRRYQHDPPW